MTTQMNASHAQWREDYDRKLGQVIAHLERTTDDDWCEGVVRRDTGGEKNCIFGHIFAMGDDVKSSNRWWNWFEDNVASTYMAYPVNDGEDPRYPQKTARSRCLAYLRDILDGKEMNVLQVIEEYEKKFALPVGPDCLRRHPEWNFAVFPTPDGPNPV